LSFIVGFAAAGVAQNLVGFLGAAEGLTATLRPIRMQALGLPAVGGFDLIDRSVGRHAERFVVIASHSIPPIPAKYPFWWATPLLQPIGDDFPKSDSTLGG
jgi:hypothetical protein